jgi:isoprenylcysteine carboxyl methyltransferase (ICMT) family protein YpbQ
MAGNKLERFPSQTFMFYVSLMLEDAIEPNIVRVIMLSIVMLSVVMLSVVMLSVIILSLISQLSCL